MVVMLAEPVVVAVRQALGVRGFVVRWRQPVVRVAVVERGAAPRPRSH
jgi:hypothetical protein